MDSAPATSSAIIGIPTTSLVSTKSTRISGPAEIIDPTPMTSSPVISTPITSTGISGTAETIYPVLLESFKALNVNNPTATKKTDGPLNYIDKNLIKPMDLDINGIKVSFKSLKIISLGQLICIFNLDKFLMKL